MSLELALALALHPWAPWIVALAAVIAAGGSAK